MKPFVAKTLTWSLHLLLAGLFALCVMNLVILLINDGKVETGLDHIQRVLVIITTMSSGFVINLGTIIQTFATLTRRDIRLRYTECLLVGCLILFISQIHLMLYQVYSANQLTWDQIATPFTTFLSVVCTCAFHTSVKLMQDTAAYEAKSKNSYNLLCSDTGPSEIVLDVPSSSSQEDAVTTSPKVEEKPTTPINTGAEEKKVQRIHVKRNAPAPPINFNTNSNQSVNSNPSDNSNPNGNSKVNLNSNLNPNNTNISNNSNISSNSSSTSLISISSSPSSIRRSPLAIKRLVFLEGTSGIGKNAICDESLDFSKYLARSPLYLRKQKLPYIQSLYEAHVFADVICELCSFSGKPFASGSSSKTVKFTSTEIIYDHSPFAHIVHNILLSLRGDSKDHDEYCADLDKLLSTPDLRNELRSLFCKWMEIFKWVVNCETKFVWLGAKNPHKTAIKILARSGLEFTSDDSCLISYIRNQNYTFAKLSEITNSGKFHLVDQVERKFIKEALYEE